MIKTFCDCCGAEMKPLNKLLISTIDFPAKRVRIEPHSNVCGVTEDFLVELSVTAKIYKPNNLMDRVDESTFLGSCICPDCIVERIIQRG
jgi:hypothetical protein